MNNKYSQNSKVCATCNFWQGQRNFTSSLRNIVDVVPGSYGDCLEGVVKKTHKMNNASCTKWQRWSAIRSYNSNNNSKTSKGKGTIPYPIFVALILLVAILNFLGQNWMYFVSIGAIVIICAGICFFLYRKAKNPKIKIAFTIVLGIILIIGVFVFMPNAKVSPQFKNAQSEATLQKISSVTVRGGYKPCFGTGNDYSINYSKIVIKGNVCYSAYNDYYYLDSTGTTEYPKLDANSVNTYFTKTTGKNAPRSTSLDVWGVFFLTKVSNADTYRIDDCIPYKYTGNDESDIRGLVKNITAPSIIQYSEKSLYSVNPIFDTWILENADE